jgi:hypothetical protein
MENQLGISKSFGGQALLGLKQVWGLMGGLTKFVTNFVLSLRNRKSCWC